MELTHDDVLEILELLDHSDVEYLELDVGGTRIVADRSGTGPRPRAEVPESTTAPAASGPVQQPPPGHDSDDLVTVTAPVVGVFYRSPEPGAPPFVEAGGQVEEGTTVGLVEVMKMFNSVAAGARGEVVEILADNEAFVEYGQPLMTIRPEPAG